LKVQIDVQSLLEKDKTGIAFTIQNIIQNMVKKHKESLYYLNYFSLLYKPKSKVILDDFWDIGCIPNECKWFHHVVYKLLYNFIPIPYSLFFGSDAEITHFMNYHVPPGVKGKVVTTIHDMAYKAYPETLNSRTLHMLKLSMDRSCRRADIIITVSNFSKDEIVKYLGVSADKIVVVPNGVDLSKFHPNYSLDEVKSVKSKYGITGDYFLYLGTLEPRKNIERLIKAYGLLKKRLGTVPNLVIAGKKGWLYDPIFDVVNTLNLNSDVIFTGYADEKDVPVLMNGAAVFVFPSLYEGFGLPPLEAMACGTPVITSNTASLPEVVGDAALLVDPYSVESIADAMESLLLDPALRAELKDKGLKRASMFTWEKSADIILEVYEQLGREIDR
jgi:glycosyltransferase involved in cell wall biosynthesis